MARRFSKIFPASVTFDDQVTVSETRKGVVYARAKADVVLPDGSTVKRTVMAFGERLMSVQPDFTPGNTVRLAVQMDGGSMCVIGYPRDRTAPAAPADAA